MKKTMVLLYIALFLLSGCARQENGTQAGTPTGTPTGASPGISTPIPANTPVPTRTAAPASEPTPGTGGLPEKAELVVCMGQEPASLYVYADDDTGPARQAVLEALYDGPIDRTGFGYQAVILEKVPSLADGDAVLQAVEVRPGDVVVDAAGRLLPLENGIELHPSGCSSPECTQVYDGQSSLVMDQMVVTFSLLPGLTWSDGSSLTVQDSLFAFNLSGQIGARDDKTLFNRTAAYEALDEHTVQWVGVPGYKDPDYFAHFWSPLPAHVLADLPPEEMPAAEAVARFPLGWGPYVIESWTEGEAIRMSRNPRYFRGSEGLPAFDRLTFRFLDAGPDAALAELLAGDCDILHTVPELETQNRLVLELERVGLLKSAFQQVNAWGHLDFGILPFTFENGWSEGFDRPDFFADPQVRRALAACSDRDGIVAALLPRNAERLDTFLASGHPSSFARQEAIDYDPVAGSLLLERQGWVDADGDGIRAYFGADTQVPNGTRFSLELLVLDGRPNLSQAAAAFTSGMAVCGVEVRASLLSPEDFFRSGPAGPVFGRQFDLAWWDTSLAEGCLHFLAEQIPAPENGWSGLNLPGLAGTDLETLCRRALVFLPTAPGQADDSLRQAQQVFADELPVLPLYRWWRTDAHRPELCADFSENPGSSLRQIETFSYGECIDS